MCAFKPTFSVMPLKEQVKIKSDWLCISLSGSTRLGGFLMIKKEVSLSAVSSAATTGGRHGAAPVLCHSVKRCFAELSHYRIELRSAGRCTTPTPSAVQLRWDISELSDNGN